MRGEDDLVEGMLGFICEKESVLFFGWMMLWMTKNPYALFGFLSWIWVDVSIFFFFLSACMRPPCVCIESVDGRMRMLIYLFLSLHLQLKCAEAPVWSIFCLFFCSSAVLTSF